MAKTKKDKTEYTHKAVTDLKAGHDPKPLQYRTDAYVTCETCGRQLIEKPS